MSSGPIIAVARKIDMKLTLCSDNDFETELANAMPKLFVFAGNSSEEVLKTVTEVFSHINVRFKALEFVRLPFQQILTYLVKTDATSLQRRFAIVYWRLATQRMLETDATLAFQFCVEHYSEFDASALEEIHSFMFSHFGSIPDVRQIPQASWMFFVSAMLSPGVGDLDKVKLLVSVQNSLSPPQDSESTAVSDFAYLIVFVAAYAHNDKVSHAASPTWKGLQTQDISNRPALLSFLFVLWFHQMELRKSANLDLLVAIIYRLHKAGRASMSLKDGLLAFQLVTRGIFEVQVFPKLIDAVFSFADQFCNSLESPISAVTFSRLSLMRAMILRLIDGREYEMNEDALQETGLSASQVSALHRVSSISLRSVLYVLLGKVIARLPFDIDNLGFFFEASKHEPSSLYLSLQEAFSWSLSKSEQFSSDATTRFLASLPNAPQSRFVLQAVNRFFPFENVKARFLNCVAAEADKEEAFRGLDPANFSRSGGIYPSFSAFISHVRDAFQTSVDPFSLGDEQRLKICLFSWKCLASQCKGILVSVVPSPELNYFAGLLLESLKLDARFIIMLTLLAQCKLLPLPFAIQQEEIDSILSLLVASDETNAHLYASLLHVLHGENLVQVSFWSALYLQYEDMFLHNRRPAATVLVALMALSVCATSPESSHVLRAIEAGLCHRSDGSPIPVEMSHLQKVLAAKVTADTNCYRSALLACYDVYRLHNFYVPSHRVSTALLELSKDIRYTLPYVVLCQGLANAVTSGEHNVLGVFRSSALLCNSKRDDIPILSRSLCVAAGGPACSLYDVDLTYVPHNRSDSDNLSFDVSDTVDIKRGVLSAETPCMPLFVEMISEQFSQDPRPFMRMNAAVLLSDLLEFCASCPSVASNLLRFQRIFLSLTDRNAKSDTDDTVGDTCSYGLSLVYRNGDTVVRKKLVDDLMERLTGSNRAASSLVVEEDSQIIPGQMLGKDPGTGKNLSTYRDLCAAASDIGRPDLIYQFLALTSHHKKFKSTESAASTVLMLFSFGDADVRKEFLPLLPRIFRYRFDPNPKISEIMSAIWTALVEDENVFWSSKANVTAVSADLLSNAKSTIWRVREAVMGGVEDIVRCVVDFDCMSPFIQDMFSFSLILMDDIKESVRKAATKAAMSVSSAIVRYCANFPSAPSVCIPFLIDNMKFDLAKATLDKVVVQSSTKNPQLLRPFAVPIVTLMLESLSVEENSKLNYAQFHAESMLNVSKEEMENMRLEMSRHSQPQRIIDSLYPLLDDAAVSELCVKICDIVRAGVGLVSRVAASRLTSQFVKFFPGAVRESGPAKLVRAFTGALSVDSSKTAQRYYIMSIVSLLKVSSSKTVEKTVHSFEDKLFATSESSSDSREQVAVFVANVFSQKCSAVLDRYRSEFIALSFIGKQDTGIDGEKSSAYFSHVWDENIENPGSGVRIYLTDILSWASRFLGDSGDWVMKKCCGKALVQAIGYGKSDVASMLDNILEVLRKALSGAQWEGRHVLIEVLDAVLTAVLPWGAPNDELAWRQFASPPSEILTSIFNILVPVVQRKHTVLLIHVFKTLEHLLERYGHLFMSDERINAFFDACESNSKIRLLILTDTTAVNVEGESEISQLKTHDRILLTNLVIRCLFLAHRVDPKAAFQSEFFVQCLRCLLSPATTLSSRRTALLLLSAVDVVKAISDSEIKGMLCVLLENLVAANVDVDIAQQLLSSLCPSSMQ
eukprot:ANDGO_03376.mRNA.1 Proteasome-associated protein ECM29 homolog